MGLTVALGAEVCAGLVVGGGRGGSVEGPGPVVEVQLLSSSTAKVAHAAADRGRREGMPGRVTVPRFLAGSPTRPLWTTKRATWDDPG